MSFLAERMQNIDYAHILSFRRQMWQYKYNKTNDHIFLTLGDVCIKYKTTGHLIRRHTVSRPKISVTISIVTLAAVSGQKQCIDDLCHKISPLHLTGNSTKDNSHELKKAKTNSCKIHQDQIHFFQLKVLINTDQYPLKLRRDCRIYK